jgi:hypothetical protein
MKLRIFFVASILTLTLWSQSSVPEWMQVNYIDLFGVGCGDTLPSGSAASECRLRVSECAQNNACKPDPNAQGAKPKNILVFFADGTHVMYRSN